MASQAQSDRRDSPHRLHTNRVAASLFASSKSPSGLECFGQGRLFIDEFKAGVESVSFFITNGDLHVLDGRSIRPESPRVP